MKLDIENLGFIKSGSFETNNLTIIFGKNNSGKTYLSHAAYILANELKSILNIFIASELKLDEVFSGQEEFVYSRKIDEIISKETIDTINTISGSILESKFNLPDGYFSETYVNFDFRTLISKATKASFEIALTSRFIEKTIIISKSKNRKTINIASIKSPEHDKKPLSSFKGVNSYFYKYQITEEIINRIVDLDIKNPFIITSERTGIEMFYKEIDNNRSDIAEKISLNKNTKSISEDDTENRISRYSSPISDNIRTVRNQQQIRKNKSDISKLTDFKMLESTLRKITKGTFKTNDSGESFYVLESGNNQEIPLHHASSSIKSMIMIDLYINHIASTGETLIIDEPELNLHPDNQILMAELIIRLVNLGVKVIMTTHSDYIVREINNRIRLSNADKKNKHYSKFVEFDGDAISSDMVNVFCICGDGEIKEITVERDGIDNVIFDDVIISSSEREDMIISLMDDN